MSATPYKVYDNAPNFQQSQCGPWGVRLDGQIQRTAELHTPFDQLQWEEAKLNGCQPAPCREYPSWPPPPETGFIYPSMSKVTQPTLLGEDLGPGTEAAPYLEKPMHLESPMEDYSGKQYSPEEILNTNDCAPANAVVPPALPGSEYGPTPIDATYDPAAYGQPMFVSAVEGNWIKEKMVGACVPPQAADPVIPMRTDSGKGPSIPMPLPGYSDPPNTNQGQKKVSMEGGTPPQPEPVPTTEHVNVIEHQPQAMTSLKDRTAKEGGHEEGPQGSAAVIIGTRVQEKIVTEDCSHCDTNAMTDKRCTRYNLKHIFPCMINAVRGIFYDLACWDELPCENQSKLSWILGREDRMFYVATLVFVLLLVYFLLRILWKSLFPDTTTWCKLNQAVWISVIAFLVYFLTPQAEGQNQLVKGISVAAIVLVLVIVYNMYTHKMLF